MGCKGQAWATTLQTQITHLNSIESVFDVVQKSQQLCVIEFIHYKNGIKWRFGALKLISVDSSFLLASPPDTCLYSKTYNYLWADIAIRMDVVTELHLNEFVVYIYEHCSCIKHWSREDSVHALIQMFFIALDIFTVIAVKSHKLHGEIITEILKVM